MRTPKENAEGYKESSAFTRADKLHGNLLLVHGMADDNVHFQNCTEYAEHLVQLGKQFDNLLQEASNAVKTEEYAERFRAISDMIEELKRRKANILQIRQEQEQIERRVHAATTVMNTIPSELTEWDDSIVYQMVEKVSVLSREKIRVTFRGGTEIEQVVDQPKRRKFA